MNVTAKTCIFAAAFTAIACFGDAENVDAGGWRWAKPMNQKAGSAFYTSNLKARRQVKSRQSNFRRSYHFQAYTQPQITVPAHHPTVATQPPAGAIKTTPTTQVQHQSIPASPVKHSQAPVIQPPKKVPSVLDDWLVH